jgi:phosphopantothenoylcysteine decarboxylase/phosphopantothenate--cysteine ligase
MGFAIAEALSRAGLGVVLVAGPTGLATPAGVHRIDVVSAQQMLEAAQAEFRTCDICFAAAAVADQRPVQRRKGKPPKGSGRQQLELEPTPDVIGTLAREMGARTLVGFSLEADDADPAEAAARAQRKLTEKQLDLIVRNRAAAIGSEQSEVTLLFRDGRSESWPPLSKHELATRLVARVLQGREPGRPA